MVSSDRARLAPELIAGQRVRVVLAYSKRGYNYAERWEIACPVHHGCKRSRSVNLDVDRCQGESTTRSYLSAVVQVGFRSSSSDFVV